MLLWHEAIVNSSSSLSSCWLEFAIAAQSGECRSTKTPENKSISSPRVVKWEVRSAKAKAVDGRSFLWELLWTRYILVPLCVVPTNVHVLGIIWVGIHVSIENRVGHWVFNPNGRLVQNQKIESNKYTSTIGVRNWQDFESFPTLPSASAWYYLLLLLYITCNRRALIPVGGAIVSNTTHDENLILPHYRYTSGNSIVIS